MAKAKRRQVREGHKDVTAALKALRERAGLTMAEMAKELGYKGASSYQRYEDPALYKKPYLPVPLLVMIHLNLVGKGTPPITSEEVEALGPPRLSPERSSDPDRGPMPLLGEVQAGVWKEVDDISLTNSRSLPIIPLFEWGRKDQYALIVRGESMNKVARDGDYVICLDLMDSGATPAAGDLVVVERTRDDESIREVTVKRLEEEFDGTPVLMPESTDPRYQQPLPYTESEGSTVTIKALVLAVISPQHSSARSFFSGNS